MKTKSIMLAMMITVSLFFAPAIAVRAQDPGMGAGDIDPDTMAMAVGQIFGMMRGFGASGDVLGRVFELMFMNFRNFSATESALKGVYVMNASLVTQSQNEQYNFTEKDTSYYYPWGQYNLNNPTVPIQYRNEYPYMKVEKSGSVNVSKTEGAAVTFFIWDNDGTLIRALDRIIQTFAELKAIEEDPNTTDEEAQKQAASAVISALTYFVIHINDIINGDEVIVLSINGFTEYKVTFENYSETVSWHHTINGQANDSTDLTATFSDWRNVYETKANLHKDSYMQWMLAQSSKPNSTYSDSYTEFSFDIIQLWMKNFEIHVDVAALLSLLTAAQNSVDSGQPPAQDPLNGTAIEDIFQGLDIEFYLLTHHFAGFILYDDTKFASDPLLNTTANNGVPDIVRRSVGTYENSSVDVIVDSEATDYLVFTGSNFHFIDPVISTESITWGIETTDLEFRVIPIGLNPSEVNKTDAPVIKMEKFKLGFSFIINAAQTVNVEEFSLQNSTAAQARMGEAKVKLVTEFGAWNDTSSIANKSLDLATVMISTILHVHLKIENKDLVVPEEGAGALMSENNYNETDHKIRVGDYKGALPLAAIDIAGPEYEQYNGTEKTTHAAKTTLIPQVYAELNAKSSQTYEDSQGGINVMSGALTIEFSALIYAVSYYSFDSTGQRIVHDPTFSIFITFDNPAFWALIFVIASVVLAGIGAFLIKKKKEESILA
jgi:hypothetical protein